MANNKITPTIVSLAILKVNWERRRDYLEIFVPMVAEAIRLFESDIVTVPDLQRKLLEQFGLAIPQNTLKTILIRTKKHGYIHQKDHAYYRNHERLSEVKQSFRDVQQQVLQMYEDLVQQFVLFCQDQFAVTLSSYDADQAFQDYLRNSELAIRGKASVPVIPSTNQQSLKSHKFYVGAFIQQLELTHSAYFSSWETIVIGNMLANSVHLPDPAQPNRRFKGTDIYFDTSFLIYALGYAGEARQAPCLELLDLLYEVGAELKCFRHTLEEIYGILSACARLVSQGDVKDSYGPSMEYFLLNGFSASDIELFATRIERDLEARRIRVIDAPDYREHRYIIDEARLRHALSEQIPYRNPNGQALDRDVASVSAIFRLRRGSQPYYVEESKAVFISTNSSLVRITNDVTLDESLPDAVPPCATDYTLTNMLWLKKPHRVPDLPRKRIIADYYAAIQPDEALLRQYQEETEKLLNDQKITSDDYYLLRYTLEAKYGLMIATHGGDEPLTTMTVPEVLEYTKNRIRIEDQNKIQDELQRRMLAEAEVAQMRAADLERQARMRARSQRWASRIIKGVRFVLIVIVFLTTITTFPWDLPAIKNDWLRYLLTLLQVGLLFITVIGTVFGTPIEVYVRRLELWFSKRIEVILLNISS